MTTTVAYMELMMGKMIFKELTQELNKEES